MVTYRLRTSQPQYDLPLFCVVFVLWNQMERQIWEKAEGADIERLLVNALTRNPRDRGFRDTDLFDIFG
jgi:hypothetical protein